MLISTKKKNHLFCWWNSPTL